MVADRTESAGGTLSPGERDDADADAFAEAEDREDFDSLHEADTEEEPFDPADEVGLEAGRIDPYVVPGAARYGIAEEADDDPGPHLPARSRVGDTVALGGPAARRPPSPRPEREARVSYAECDIERIRTLYGNIAVGLIAEMLAAAVLIALASDSVPVGVFAGWLLFMAASSAYRLSLSIRYRNGPDGVGDAWRAEGRMARAAACSGLGWGAGALLLMPLGHPLQEGLFALVIGAVAIVAADVLLASTRVARWLIAPALAGAAIALAVYGGPARWIAAGLLLALLGALLGVVQRRHDNLLGVIRSRLGNQALLRDLETTNHALGEARRDEGLMFDTALVGIAIVKQDRIARCNRKLEEIFGYRRGTLQGAATKVLYGSETAWREARAYLQEDLRAGGLHDSEREFFRRDGTQIWCRYRGQPLDAADIDAGALWVFEDLSEQKRAAEELMRGEEELVAADRQRRAANARLVDAMESVPDAIALFDSADRLINCNQRYIEHFPGSPPRTVLLGKTYEQLVTEAVEGGEPVPPDYRKARTEWVAVRMAWHRRADGETFVYQTSFGHWYQLRERPTTDGGVVLLRTDVTELKQIEERVRHLAYHDPLTGLPNRRLLDDRLAQACNMARRTGAAVAVMVIDLDRFKVINDTRGHEAGDVVLKEVAARLQQSVRKVDTVARQGGDEFVVVLTELKRVSDAGRVAKKILNVVAAPVGVRGEYHEIGASIGIAVFPTDGTEPDVLLKQADNAMYRAKGAGRGGFEFASRQPTQSEFKFE